MINGRAHLLRGRRRLRRAAPGAGLALLLLSLPACPRAQADAAGADISQAPATTPLPVPQLLVPSNVQPDLVAPAAPANYVIGDNDLLSVFVYQMPEMTRQVRVSSAGYIRIPFAQKNFAATGKTVADLQAEIADDLVAEGLVRSPVVQVTVVQVASKPIVVGGAVQRPVVIQAARPMRLLEVLANAGGLTSAAGNSVLVTQNKSAGSQTSSRSYNLDALIRNNSQADNPLLAGNETVTVMPARMVYVVGEFNRPGAFPITMGEPITVLKAVSLAQGFTANPDKGHAEIIRTLPDGSQLEVPIAIDKIIDRKIPDPQMQAGDLLYVGDNERRKVLLSGLSDAAQLLTLGAAYHFP